MSVRGLSNKPFCSNTFSVDSKFHRKIRKLMNEAKKEYGGDSRVDFTKGLILPATMQVGGYDKVDLNRGVIDWHTHPNKCLNSSKCTIGLPSPSDMANVAIGVADGTLAHLIYSREGTYVVQMMYKERAKLFSDLAYRTSKPKSVEAAFNRLFDAMDKTDPHVGSYRSKSAATQVSYSNFSKQFRELAKAQGFCLQLFKGNAIPKFSLHYNCSALSGGPGLTFKSRSK